MNILRLIVITGLALALSACNEGPDADVRRAPAQDASVAAAPPSPRILAMGDSLLATNRMGGNAVSDGVERLVGEEVVDRSIIGASMLYPLPITGSMGLRIGRQYVSGNWDWVILNGGGNDLFFGCGCLDCTGTIARMVSSDGRKGVIPQIVAQARQSGARVVFVGYLRSPGVGSLIDECRNEGDEFEGRISRMAAADDGVFFVSLKDLVPYGDRSFHGADLIHPSRKGSAAIASRIAEVIKTHPARRARPQ